jgi:hypothetical protein
LWGGTESWRADLVRALREGGWDVVVGAAWGSRFKRVENFRRTHPDFDVVPLDGRTGTAVGRRLAIDRALRRARHAGIVPVGLADVLEVVWQQKIRRRTTGCCDFERSRSLGRLDRWLPGGALEAVRCLLRRFPPQPDGWGEWPGI